MDTTKAKRAQFISKLIFYVWCFLFIGVGIFLMVTERFIPVFWIIPFGFLFIPMGINRIIHRDHWVIGELPGKPASPKVVLGTGIFSIFLGIVFLVVGCLRY